MCHHGDGTYSHNKTIKEINMTMNFLKDFEKIMDKEEGIGGSAEPPRYWYPIGNYCLNRILSGSFMRGIPQGRLTGIVGPSGSGKSFIIGNAVKSAQDAGAFILVIDSENALDDDYMSKIGVNVHDNYMYKSVTTIPQVIKVVSSFIKGYTAEYGDADDAPPIFIAIDSLDMLSTESEAEHFAKGDSSSDQGLRAKQLKQMLRQFVQAIKGKNIAMAVTAQVYQATAQQILAGEGVWVVNQAIRYALSQIILLTKLKLKDDKKEVTGIRMKVEGFKTRFTKPFQTVTVEVPYDTGMDPLSGLLEAAVNLGVVEKRGSRYAYVGDEKTWYEKDMDAKEILTRAEALSNVYLSTKVDPDEIDKDQVDKVSMKAKRKSLVDSASE
jgi:recombination protein RecA